MNIELVSSMGDDLSVVNAARVSYHRTSHSITDRDVRLIKYLAANGHWSPFAHPQVSLRIEAPIYIARQLMRHQVGLTVNEVSRRYTNPKFGMEFPTEWRMGYKKSSKETPIALDDFNLELVNLVVASYAGLAESVYDFLLAKGITREQARTVLPVSSLTQWIWTGSLFAFARVYQQRVNDGAQAETRELVTQLGSIMETLFPVCWPYVSKQMDASDYAWSD